MFDYDVVALGELLIDFTANGRSPQGNGLFEANPGGAPCNVLAILTKLGRKTAFVGKVGEDLFGRLLKEAIEGVGIDSTGLVLDPAAKTTLAFVQNDAAGDREFSFYRSPGADELLRAGELPRQMLNCTRIFHFGSLSLTREPIRSATQAAAAAAKEGGALISFDPNLREPLWEDLDEARAQMRWGCSVCDVIKLAGEELAFLTCTGTLDAGVDALRRDFPNLKLVLVTRGSLGSAAYWNGETISVPAYLLENTVDTTGAGDTFFGCCLHRLLDWGLEGLNEDRLTQMLQFANAGAGLITTKKGALRSMPEYADIQNLMAEGEKEV